MVQINWDSVENTVSGEKINEEMWAHECLHEAPHNCA